MTAWPQEILPESTWSDPTDNCPHPDRWHGTDVGVTFLNWP